MRCRVGVALLALVVGSCGGGSGAWSETTTVAAEPPTTSVGAGTTSRPPVTTSGAESTTPPSSTVTTQSPVTVPDPGPPSTPLLLTPSGAPESVDRICVEIITEGLVTGDFGRVGVTHALELLGVEIVEDDCRAALTVSATGHRYSATYQELGECWTGRVVNSETVFTFDGVVQRTWTAERDTGTAYSILPSQCAQEDEPIELGPLDFDQALIESFRDMWGDVGHFVILSASPALPFPEDFELTDPVMQLVTTRLLTEPTMGDIYGEPIWRVLSDWTAVLAFQDREDRLLALRPLTPVLITLLDRPQGRYSIFQYHGAALPSSGSSAERDIVTTLERITGQSLESPAEWWAWWGEQ
jgi:hypothetical protein